MMITSRVVASSLLWFTMVWSAPGMADIVADGVVSPVDQVRDATRKLLTSVDQRRDEIARSPACLYSLIEEILLPQIDYERMSRWILGRHWRKATPNQRAAFGGDLRNMLIRTYSSALLDFTDVKVEYLPLRKSTDPQKVVVVTRVIHQSALPIAINYRMYQLNGSWKIYDVTVEGISMVATLRNSISAEIKRFGLAGFLADLELRNQKLEARDVALAEGSPDAAPGQCL